MDVVMTCFCFAIFIVRLCRARMINMDEYEYFWYYALDRSDDVGFLESLVACGIF